VVGDSAEDIHVDQRAQQLHDGKTRDRARVWAATMEGFDEGLGLRLAHTGGVARLGGVEVLDRAAREEDEDRTLAPGATRSNGPGNRVEEEDPDPFRTCFERDRDRILHSPAFRRLAGKTQVFVFPDDHQRTRLTHALEVAQVATAIARALRLNVALAEAIALGHDCGHGPGGHASEETFGSFLADGYDHAVWGADVVLAPLNLTREVLDGIRNHSWSRPATATPEGEVVSWADRIAYCAHDLEDAVNAGLVVASDLPAEVRELCGSTRSRQLRTFIIDVVTTSAAAGVVSMSHELAGALSALRQFNYERVYMRPESIGQGIAVQRMLGALVEHLTRQGRPDGMSMTVREAVSYVAGMTDRYACESAISLLDWPLRELPGGFDLPRVAPTVPE